MTVQVVVKPPVPAAALQLQLYSATYTLVDASLDGLNEALADARHRVLDTRATIVFATDPDGNPTLTISWTAP